MHSKWSTFFITENSGFGYRKPLSSALDFPGKCHVNRREGNVLRLQNLHVYRKISVMSKFDFFSLFTPRNRELSSASKQEEKYIFPFLEKILFRFDYHFCSDKRIPKRI